MSLHKLCVRGAKVHNLKNIDVEIPHGELVVITGLSGSGKSTLAFDTIFAEGQRRYVESLSAYARQFLGRIDKPDVESITGIAPAIAIEQKVNTRNPRSTVGTTTEVYDYLRLMFARVGHTFSPVSGNEVVAHHVSDVVEWAQAQSEGARVIIAAPLSDASAGSGSTAQSVIEQLLGLVQDGFQRVYVDGKLWLIEDYMPIVGSAAAEISVVVDRIKVANGNEEQTQRLGDSIAKAFAMGGGDCMAIVQSAESGSAGGVSAGSTGGGGTKKGVAGDRIERFSSRFEMDGIAFEEPTEHLFSFNNPIGACPRCEGYGKVTGIDEDLVVPDKSRSVFDDAIACWRGETMSWWKDQLVNAAHRFDFPVHAPYYDLTREQRQLLWTGNEHFMGLDQFFKHLERERYKIQYRVMLSRYTGKTVCPDCGGARLRKEALYVRVGGRTIAELVAMPIAELHVFFTQLALNEHDSKIGERIVTEVRNRLQYLLDVGLGYLTLDRLSATLSGGESQRINLATSLGSNLTGSLYILDEPSIGLHPRDTRRLIGVLRALRDLGNTVIVVEHEEEIIRAADRIIDIGPEAGYLGGEVVYNGDIHGLIKAKRSLTADYMTGRKGIEKPASPRGWSNHIDIEGARENNLKGVTARIPLGAMTCVTGVSGSGKSSLVKGILYPALRRHLYETSLKPGNYERLSGDIGMLASVEMVDQNPIGKSSRSNPVTYIKAYDDIRKLFADQPFAKASGFTPSNFSFNIAGGRCEECQGEGVIRVSMQFMADVELKCEACGGRRFKDEILEVRYKGNTIYDILEMTVDDAASFFADQPRLLEKLKALQDVGLGYVKLGQSSSTLSGGESQRVKLAAFLLKENTAGQTMFIFDEPTTGLHFHDIKKLLAAFNALISRGHTIVVVEHNMEVIKCADWVVDLGPEAGDAGGNLVFEGTPDGLAKCKESYTGKYLAGK